VSWLGRFLGLEVVPPSDALAAAAIVMQGNADPEDQAQSTDMGNPRRKLLPTAQAWQREVWDFYDSLGMYRNAVTWKSDMLSRCRLRAGIVNPDRDEPTIIDTGPAADLMNDLAGGPGKQSQLIGGLEVYITVPGEGYLVGETMNGRNKWQARSSEEIRLGTRTVAGEQQYQIIDERTVSQHLWRDMDPESFVVRVWRPHRRFYHVADSSSRAARDTMRELELVNRHIKAQYMSRLASAGIIVFPEEVTFPVRPEFQDAPDPFVAEWIETAAQAIAQPGTAAAVIPIPIRVPGEYVDKIRHIDFTQALDRLIIQKRESAVKQLAVDLDIPPEALLGMGGANHWSGWLIDEQGFKVYLAPDMELLCDALTTGYLHPMLRSLGQDTTDIVVWYDPSELLLRPDRSENAKDAYDRLELSGKALRRELGMDEDDAPADDEIGDLILKMAAKYPMTIMTALHELTGILVEPVPVARESIPGPPAAGGPAPKANPPANQGPTTAPPTKKAAAAEDVQDVVAQLRADISESLSAQQDALRAQGALMHAIRINFEGDWTLLHPSECEDHQFSCPVTHATWGPLVAMPGMSGVYECWLNPSGQPIIGGRVTKMDTANMISSTLWRKGSNPSLQPAD
jgi:hypothetical protein